jgi:tripartite-type tricarboxylate transporter receptor subunit TctC
VKKALNFPDVRKSLESQGADPVANSPDEYDRYNRAEIARWIEVARKAGVQPE